MSLKNERIGVPSGLLTLLPDTAEIYTDIELKFIDLMRKNGYKRVIPPTFEYYRTFVHTSDVNNRIIRFLDFDNKTLALRFDITPQIARIVGEKLGRNMAPLDMIKFYYTGSVFRDASPQSGMHREIRQMGCEIFSHGSHIFESIKLAIIFMEIIGLKNYKFDIGNAIIYRGLKKEIDNIHIFSKVLSLIENKEISSLETYVSTLKLNNLLKKYINELPTMFGDVRVINKLQNYIVFSDVKEAIEELNSIYHKLEKDKLTEKIGFDLGISKNIDYYTGTIFECYMEQIGNAICSGGEYNGLTGKYGYEMNGCGFSFSVDPMIKVIAKNTI